MGTMNSQVGLEASPEETNWPLHPNLTAGEVAETWRPWTVQGRTMASRVVQKAAAVAMGEFQLRTAR